MKILLLVIIFLVINGQDFSNVNNPLFCGRNYNNFIIDNGYTNIMTGTPTCYFKNTTNIASSIQFAISTFKCQYILLTSIINSIPFSVYLYFGGVFEYQEGNGIVGYQGPSYETTDYSGSYTPLSDRWQQPTRFPTQFSPISYSKSNVLDGVTIHTSTFSLQKSTIDCCIVYVTTILSTKEVSVLQNGTYSSNMIIIPNSLKITISLRNITYSSKTSTGIGILLLVTATSDFNILNNTSPTTNQSINDFRPTESNLYQNSYKIYNNIANRDGSSLSWIKNFIVSKNNSYSYHPVNINYAKAIDGVGATLCYFNAAPKTIYFSTTIQVDTLDLYLNLISSEDVDPKLINVISNSHKNTFIVLYLCIINILFF